MAGNLNPTAGNGNITVGNPNLAAGISNMAGATVGTTLPTLDDAQADRKGKLLSEAFWKKAMDATPETQHLDVVEQDEALRILRAQEVPAKYTQHNQWKILRAYIEGESTAIPRKICPYICVVMWRMKHCLGKPSAGFHGPSVEALAAKGLTIQDLIEGDQDKIGAAIPLTVRVQRLESDNAMLVQRVQGLEMAGSPAGNNQQVGQPLLDVLESRIKGLELQVKSIEDQHAQLVKEIGERDGQVAEYLHHIQGFLSGGYTPIEILLGKFKKAVPSKRPASAQQPEVHKKIKTDQTPPAAMDLLD